MTQPNVGLVEAALCGWGRSPSCTVQDPCLLKNEISPAPESPTFLINAGVPRQRLAFGIFNGH